MGNIRKLRFSHDFIIDEVIKDPAVDRRFLARKFKLAESSISNLLTSDAFRTRLNERRAELSDPLLIKTVDERLRALADYSLQLLTEVLEKDPSPHLLLETARMSTKALADNAAAQNKATGPSNNFVVLMPGKAESSEDWARTYQGSAVNPALPNPDSNESSNPPV